jgi:hypothetical protein
MPAMVPEVLPRTKIPNTPRDHFEGHDDIEQGVRHDSLN